MQKIQLGQTRELGLLLGSLAHSKQHDYLSLLKGFKTSYTELHQLVDKLILAKMKINIEEHKLEKSSSVEEEKSQDLSQQYESFVKEASESHTALNSLLGEEQADTIKQKLAGFKDSEKKWNQKFKMLEDVGLEALKAVSKGLGLTEEVKSLTQKEILELLKIGTSQTGNNQDESDFLFFLQSGSNQIQIFNLSLKEAKSYELSFEVPKGCGVCHAENSLFLAGGQKYDQYYDYTNQFDTFYKLNTDGDFILLANLITVKANFPMPYWKTEKIVFTIGGQCGKVLQEVTQFSTVKNEWSKLPNLPCGVCLQAATIMNETILNFGGKFQPHSILSFNLRDPQPVWKEVTLNGANFEGYCFRDATVIQNQIIVFGSHEDVKSYILEKEGDDQFKATPFEQTFTYESRHSNASFCTWKGQLYAHPGSSNQRVYQLNLKTKAWETYF